MYFPDDVEGKKDYKIISTQPADENIDNNQEFFQKNFRLKDDPESNNDDLLKDGEITDTKNKENDRKNNLFVVSYLN